jgi:hypothetical protein
MKRLIMLLSAIAVLVPASLWAQDVPKAEVFGGFSVFHIKGDGASTTPVGWQASVAGNVTNSVSIVGDFGGQYKDGASAYQYLGGVRFNHRAEKVTPFAHALLGGSRVGDDTGSINGFTLGFGGGLDYSATDRVNIRIVQVDWLPTRFSEGGASAWQKKNVRFGFGVVFKVGSM